jgi:leucyl aminopeptidase
MTKFAFAERPDPSVPLAVVVFQEGKKLAWGRAARSYPTRPLETAAEDGFQGKPGGSFIVRPADARPARRLLLLSAGPKPKATLETLRSLGGTAFKRSADARLGKLQLLLPDDFGDPRSVAQAFAEGFFLGSYRFVRHKSAPDARAEPAELTLIGPKAARSAALEGARLGEVFAGAVNFARDLINEPPSLKVPEVLAGAARRLAKGPVKVRVYRKAELARMKMNALLGVNRGSAHPPVLVHLHYKPSGRPKRRLAVVGKGITFDSGGLSLKTADGMMGMKYDMSGAATVFALFRALAELRPPVEVHGVAPVTENMPGPDAYKPGDVVRAANGRTIEVLNTDAEGRVILADGLSFASRLPVDEIVDVATLTGAVTVALGRAYAALMTNDDRLAERLGRAAAESGEKIWRLPLEASYKEHIKSKVADLKNIGNAGEAGTIIGGLFLEEFVAGKPWAHLDIAGAGWNSAGSALGGPGATGVMVRTLLRHILN